MQQIAGDVGVGEVAPIILSNPARASLTKGISTPSMKTSPLIKARGAMMASVRRRQTV